MRRILWAFGGALVLTIGLSAQESNTQGQGATSPTTPAPAAQAPATQSPTTPAPAASASANADKKVTLSGCIERQPPSVAAVTGAPTMPFTLANASPAGARSPVGTSGSTGAASAASAKSYRLDAAESTLSPHVGHKVEITGTIEEASASPAAGAAASGSPSTAMARLKVDSVKMVSTSCQ
jgi:hypothetical protein